MLALWWMAVVSPVPWLLIALAAVWSAPIEHAGAWSVVLAGALALRLASDGHIARMLRGVSLEPRDYAAIVAKDILFIGLWAVGLVKRSVCWRGNALRIGAGSRLYPAETRERIRAALEGA